MKEKLFNRSYILILAANFLLYMGFYLLLPVLPFYLSEVFNADNSTIGAALSCYTIAALVVRPFSGYLLDAFARKPLYMLAYTVYMLVFGAYIGAFCLAMFVAMRIVHGAAFGTVTVGGNTIVIDVMPSSRRGEGLGYYGMANNIAMSIGPMIGLFMHESFSFNTIFLCSFISCAVGLIAASMIKTKPREKVARPPISLDRFILVRGLGAGLTLMLLSIPYGITTTYIAMYGRQLDVEVSSGFFFTLLALGIASSRIFSGKLVDRGHTVGVILSSIAMATIVFILLSTCGFIAENAPFGTTPVFLASALLMGISYGTMFPAYNTLFVNLAPNSQRGTAVSTYLTSWDCGIGAGLLTGGYISQHLGFEMAYATGATLSVISFIIFRFVVGPHYKRVQATKSW